MNLRPSFTPSLWSNAALFLLPALCLTLPSGYSYGAAVLLITSLVGANSWWRARKKLPSSAWQLYVPALLLALSWLLDSIISGAGSSAFEKPLKIAFTLPCFMYVRLRPPQVRWLWIGTVMGCFAACGIAFWQIATDHPLYYAADKRVTGFTNAIQFGNLALLLGILSLCAWNASPSPAKRWYWRGFLGLAFAASLLVSLLSSSRGGWLGLVLLFGLLMLFWLLHGHWRPLLLASAGLALVLGIIWSTSRTRIEPRLNEISTEITAYEASGQANTSIGARLQMWLFAAQLYQQRPVLGWSQKGYMQQIELGVQEKKLDPLIATFNHPHNEILDSAAKRGTLGLLLLLANYGAPLWVFGRLFRKSIDPQLRSVCAAGMLLPLSYAAFGLTEAFLPHTSATTFYFYMLPLLWGAAWGIKTGSRIPSSLN